MTCGCKLKVFVVGLAIPFIGGTDGATVGDFPGLIADDGLFLAVFVSHFELQQQARRAEAKHMVCAVPVGVGFVVADACVSTAFKDDSHSVVALLEHLRDIVGVEIHATRVPGKRRFQQFLGRDFPSIEVGTIHAHTADIQPSFINLTFEGKVLAEITGCQAGFTYQHIVLKLMANPLGLPVVLVQQADFKRFDFAFHFGFLAFGGNGRNDFPVGFVAALEFLARVRDVKHLVGRHHA